MILIASGAYIASEFQIELGKLPPAFLPLANSRLYEHQIKDLRNAFPEEKVYLSLPKSFSIPSMDIKKLEKLSINIISVDDGLTLGQSITSSIMNAQDDSEQVRLLHGDTLLGSYSVLENHISLGKILAEYEYELDHSIKDEFDLAWAGFFSFKSKRALVDAITSEDGDFVKGVRRYDEDIGLSKIIEKKWFDFGHLVNYFTAREQFTSQREFNSLESIDGCFLKSGVPHSKIIGEMEWFQNIDSNLKIYTPKIIKRHANSNPYYLVEILPFLPLNEIFVYGQKSSKFWYHCIDLCDEFLQKCSNVAIPKVDLRNVHEYSNHLFLQKPWSRFKEFCDDESYQKADCLNIINGYEVPSINNIISDCVSRISKMPPIHGVLHGDLCLSNILYDSRRRRITVIDPRGIDHQNYPFIYGDLKYDLAKLSHSFLGLYDYIVANNFTLSHQVRDGFSIFDLTINFQPNTLLIQEAFKSKNFFNKYSWLDLMPLTVLLFLSMLPLHSDQPRKQLAFLARGLDLYSEILREERL
tara:strand:+ start:525 stop:2102 length:1578 start_codon:yes stop_codon:yes gene_type:complete